MKVLGVVPARGGSKRVPRKNILPLGGIPLINHCLRAAKACGRIDRLVVSTEDAEIKSVVMAEGVEVIYRPTELAQDNTPTLPVIIHAMEELAKSGFKADIILTIQPPYPFITADNMAKTIEAFENGKEFDSVTTVVRAPFRYHPFNARRVNDDSTIAFMFPEEKKNCPNTQSAPPVYFFGNLYASKRTTILEKGSLYGDSSFPVEVSSIESFDIDDMFDMELAECLMKMRSR
jgi:N-acylneuraminate cytidylyltransferase/CMP-N,N'-diacetyllegionaminic acid synthase